MSGIRSPQRFDDVGHMVLDGAGLYAQDHRRFLVDFTHAGPRKGRRAVTFTFSYGQSACDSR